MHPRGGTWRGERPLVRRRRTRLGSGSLVARRSAALDVVARRGLAAVEPRVATFSGSASVAGAASRTESASRAQSDLLERCNLGIAADGVAAREEAEGGVDEEEPQ